MKLLRDKQTVEIQITISEDKNLKEESLWCLVNFSSTLKSRSTCLGVLQDCRMIKHRWRDTKDKRVWSLEITWNYRGFSFGISVEEALTFNNGELVSIEPLIVKQGNGTQQQLNTTDFRKHFLPKYTVVSCKFFSLPICFIEFLFITKEEKKKLVENKYII